MLVVSHHKDLLVLFLTPPCLVHTNQVVQKDLIPLFAVRFNHCPGVFMRFDYLFEVLAPYQIDLTIVLRHLQAVGVVSLVHEIYVSKELTHPKSSYRKVL